MDDYALSRRALLLGLTAAATLPLVGCGKDDVPALLTAKGVQRVVPPPTAPVDQAVAGLTAFGHELLVASYQPNTNWVASPLSVAVAFAMARVGAGGSTASELDATFGFPASGRDEAFNAITRELVTADVPPKPDTKPRDPRDKPKPPVMTLGNALFLQKSFPVGQEFLRTLAAQYGAGVRPVDFSRTDAVKAINHWADRQTAGRIKKVFDSLDPATKFVLANAVYFKGDWSSFFLEVGTGPFRRADGQQLEVPTIGGQRSVRYVETAGLRAIELEYAAGPYAMWVILPPVGGKPEDGLTRGALAAIRGGLADARAEVTMPKWDFATTIDLTPALKTLGLRAPFEAANFDGIAPGIFISDAVHKANISVDEWGTEAAAVTAIAGATAMPPQAAIEFRVDRPFAFAIVGGEDHIPLFIGRVSDPSAH
jgi:serpin B